MLGIFYFMFMVYGMFVKYIIYFLKRIIFFVDECICIILLLVVSQEVDSYYILCLIEFLDILIEQVNLVNLILKKKKIYKLIEVIKISYKEGR